MATQLEGLSADGPWIVCAVERELRGLRRRLKPWLPIRGWPCRAWCAGHPGTLILATGVGGKAVRRVLADVPARLEPRLVISAGFAGALQEGLTVGSLVVATRVIGADGRIWPTHPIAQLPSFAGHRGGVLSVEALIADPEEKRRLGRCHDAIAVEMEAAAVAAWCAQRRVPFACVRAISDDVRMPLTPQLVSLLAGGRVQPWALLAALARRPLLARDLIALARTTALAAQRLGDALAAVLAPWEKQQLDE